MANMWSNDPIIDNLILCQKEMRADNCSKNYFILSLGQMKPFHVIKDRQDSAARGKSKFSNLTNK